MGGDTVGRYIVEDVWREEPAGRIVRARFAELNRPLYIKELVPPPSLEDAPRAKLLAAFEEEFRGLGQLDDTRLARPYDFGLTPAGGCFVAFDRPETAGFRPLGTDSRAFGTGEWLRIAVEICATLEELDRSGVVVYPFSPEFVWISTDGGIQVLPLSLSHLPLRCGLARSFLPDAERSDYEAPGVLEANGPAQVFSIAAWLYSMLARKPGASPAAEIAAGRQPEPLWILNPEVRSATDDVLQRALHPDPARRFSTVGAFGAALGSARPGTATRPAVAASELATVPEVLEPQPWAEKVPVWGAWGVALTVAGWLAGLGLARLLAQ